MKQLPWIIAVCATTLAGHMYLYSTSRIEMLEGTVELSEKARRIESDQVRDLMYVLQQEKQENSVIESRAFVAGVVDALQRPDHHQKIWHDGYDRGAEVQKYSDNTIKPENTELGY